jgi:hypothetical protein
MLVYKPTNLGKHFFELQNTHFTKENVIKRIQSSGRKVIKQKGINLYKVIYTHSISHDNNPVTRQALFHQYKLGKYEIDLFKHNLIEIGLIKKVPPPISERYLRERNIPRYSVALEPRFFEITPNDLTSLLND